jgi:ankyrin repeat protein
MLSIILLLSYLSTITLSAMETPALQHIPNEMLLYITNTVDIPSIKQLKRTSHRYNRLINLDEHIKKPTKISLLKTNLYLNSMIHYAKQGNKKILSHLIKHASNKNKKITINIMRSLLHNNVNNPRQTFPMKRYIQVFSGRYIPEHSDLNPRGLYAYRLLTACATGQKESVQLIAKLYPTFINTLTDCCGNYPLHFACSNYPLGNGVLIHTHAQEKIPVVKILLKHGANTTVKNKSGQTPLDITPLRYQHTNIATYLTVMLSTILSCISFGLYLCDLH